MQVYLILCAGNRCLITKKRQRGNFFHLVGRNKGALIQFRQSRRPPVALNVNDLYLSYYGVGFPLNGAGSYNFPGGGLEGAEALDAAAKREFQEETGVDLTRENILQTTIYGSDPHAADLDYRGNYQGVFCRVADDRFDNIRIQITANITAANAAVTTCVRTQSTNAYRMNHNQSINSVELDQVLGALAIRDHEQESVESFDIQQVGGRWTFEDRFPKNANSGWFHNLMTQACNDRFFP